MVGCCVHNQRTEILSRDVNVQVINNFYNQFIFLEEKEMLDPLNEAD